MFARPYSTVVVHVAHEQPQRYDVPADEAHDFAADRYAHYQRNLGAYTGSSRMENGILDRFEHGTILIANPR